jgi:hypothetical protein
VWNKLVKSLAEYPDTVVTGLDGAGYPFSVRCVPQVDRIKQIIRVQLPTDAGVQQGPAGLLCHSHNEWLWNLKSFFVYGRLEMEQKGWIFRPERMTQGGGTTNPFETIKSMVKAQRTARQYIKKRGLPWPSVPWKAIKALRTESKKKISETQ